MTEPKTGTMLIDEAELCCILLENLTGEPRPKGMSAAQALDSADINENLRDRLRYTAQGIVDYMVACMNRAGLDIEDGGYHKGGRFDA